uniref:Ripply transcriptional repressor 1 n=1 Tax=Spermophilus dauricus TaxID=99837 RepID=A0A8C9P1S3_SPEDA
MDPAAPAALVPVPDLALALPPVSQELPGLLHPSSLLSSGQEIPGSERGACLWRPWLSSTNDPPRQVRKLVDWVRAGFLLGPTGASVYSTSLHLRPCFFSAHRLFWPKSRSFDYLYSAGEILLQNFPVQATINLYEDSNSEDEEEEEEEEESACSGDSFPHFACSPLKSECWHEMNQEKNKLRDVCLFLGTVLIS